jgi:signal transduction histidine kinase
VLVKLTCTGSLLTLVITDDGVGFEITQKISGIGLTNMISRASLFDGVFALESEKGKGCTLTVGFPVIYAEGKCRPEKL